MVHIYLIFPFQILTLLAIYIFLKFLKFRYDLNCFTPKNSTKIRYKWKWNSGCGLG